jgi:hypothetical protein
LDPELLATYLALAGASRNVTSAQVEELVQQLTRIIAAAVERGEFAVADPALGPCRLTPVHRASAHDGKAPAPGELADSCLHAREHDVVHRVEVRMRAELLALVDRLEYLDRDLGWERHVTEDVADVDAPRERDRYGHDLEVERLVEPERVGECLPRGS